LHHPYQELLKYYNTIQ